MGPELPAGPPTLSSSARWLGFAGLAPQILLAVVIIADPARLGAAAAGVALAYSGIILSFIGGTWWGLASRPRIYVPSTVWIAAVTPSLIASIAVAGSAIGLRPGQSLWLTGVALIATLGVDLRLAASGVSPPGWLRLRVPLSLGLGALTIVIAILS